MDFAFVQRPQKPMLSAVVVRVVVIVVIAVVVAGTLVTFALLHALPPAPSCSPPSPSSIHFPPTRPCTMIVGRLGVPQGRLATHKRPDIGCKTLPRNSPKGSSCRSGCQPLAATSKTLPMPCKDQVPKTIKCRHQKAAPEPFVNLA